MKARARPMRISAGLEKTIREFAKKNDMELTKASDILNKELEKYMQAKKKIRRELTF